MSPGPEKHGVFGGVDEDAGTSMARRTRRRGRGRSMRRRTRREEANKYPLEDSTTPLRISRTAVDGNLPLHAQTQGKPCDATHKTAVD